MKRANLATLFEFREKKITQLEDRRISAADFANSIFGFVVRYHVKPVTKAQNKAQVLLNYFYWLTFIERKVVMEEHLIDMGLGTKEQLEQSVKVYVKRRDKMVSRLLTDLNEKPIKVIKLTSDHFEVHLEDGIVLYASKEVMDEAKISVFTPGKTTFYHYAVTFITPF